MPGEISDPLIVQSVLRHRHPDSHRCLLRLQIESVSDLEVAPFGWCGKRGSSKTDDRADSSNGFEKITSLHRECLTEPNADRQWARDGPCRRPQQSGNWEDAHGDPAIERDDTVRLLG